MPGGGCLAARHLTSFCYLRSVVNIWSVHFLLVGFSACRVRRRKQSNSPSAALGHKRSRILLLTSQIYILIIYGHLLNRITVYLLYSTRDVVKVGVTGIRSSPSISEIDVLACLELYLPISIEKYVAVSRAMYICR